MEEYIRQIAIHVETRIKNKQKMFCLIKKDAIESRRPLMPYSLVLVSTR